MIKTPSKKEQNKLKKFLNAIINKENGYELGEPWKFSDTKLLVAVPIIRKNAPKRQYITMYEALKDVGIKDTGSISVLEMQNKTGKPIFVRAGTIFSGKTQNRATQHSGVYKHGDTIIPLNVRCVHLSHGIRGGAEMKYGSIAPLSVTYNLMFGDQSSVWSSIIDYTRGKDAQNTHSSPANMIRIEPVSDYRYVHAGNGWSGMSGCSRPPTLTGINESVVENLVYTTQTSNTGCAFTVNSSDAGFSEHSSNITTGADDLLGFLSSKGKGALDEALETIPLFEDQAGVVVFNATGVLSLETFDSPKSWEAIKNDIKEKYGDKTKDEEADHLFDLNKDKIVPLLKKFINDKMNNITERVRYQDDYSTTMSIQSDGVVGEYTMIKDKVIHCLLVKR